MTPTRQDMLDSITHKIAQTIQGEWTGHNDCLTCGEQNIFTTHTCIIRKPVMIGDWLDYIDNNNIHEKVASSYPRGHTFTPPHEETRMLWKTKREPLSAQSDDCINYIFNLLPPTPNQV